MPDPPTDVAASDGAEIPFESKGEGTAVIFIHAGIADRRMWEPQFASVPEGYQFIRLDLRGFGECDLGDSPFSNHEDVLAVLDHVDADRAVVTGSSMGGGIAIDVALTAPERVLGLVLVGAAAPGLDVEEYEPPQYPDLVKAFKSGDLERAARLEAEIWVVGYGRSLPDVDPTLFDRVVEMDEAALANEKRRDELTVLLDPPRASRMGELSVPTLVIVGEHDLPDIRVSADYLAANHSHHGAVVVPGSGHLPSLERPEVFDPALTGFLESFR